MRTKYKPWAKPYIEEHQEIAITASLINERKEPIYLEIGSGKGQFLLDMAKNNPSLFFVGIERNVTCAGFTAKKLVENEVENARLVWDNAERFLLDVNDNKVNTIFLNFSDPWPKKRHAKRRLTANEFLKTYYRILINEGKIIIKTDQKDLYDFTLENIQDSPFKLVSCTENYAELDSFDVLTEYEKDFREEGLPIYRIVLQK
jgi:tRNA (guanine-N7-)-methyltransferase